MRGEVVSIYWSLLVPYALFAVVLEFFKLPEKSPDAGGVLKRVVVSIILLFSFDQCMELIASIANSLSERIGGMETLGTLLARLGASFQSGAPGWLDMREALVYWISILSYMVAYLGVVIAEVLTQFVWAILYVASPLMILMMVWEKTAFITLNLYRGLATVAVWKVLWALLALLLLKVAESSPDPTFQNFVETVVLNLLVGLSMVFVPLASSSLISSGLSSSGAAMAVAPMAAGLAIAKTKILRGAGKNFSRRVGMGSQAFGGSLFRGRQERSSQQELRQQNPKFSKSFNKTPEFFKRKNLNENGDKHNGNQNRERKDSNSSKKRSRSTPKPMDSL